MPGIDGRDGGQVLRIPQIGHQITGASGVDIDGLVHVTDREPIELMGPDRAQHRHPSPTVVVVADTDRFWDLSQVREGGLEVVEDPHIVVIRRASNTRAFL